MQLVINPPNGKNYLGRKKMLDCRTTDDTIEGKKSCLPSAQAALLDSKRRGRLHFFLSPEQQ